MRILIGLAITETESGYRISAAAGMEQEALSKTKGSNLYSLREPILLTSTGVSAKELHQGINACVKRIVEKLYLQKVFSDTNYHTKNILIIVKPRFKNLNLAFPCAVSQKSTLINIAKKLDKERTI